MGVEKVVAKEEICLERKNLSELAEYEIKNNGEEKRHFPSEASYNVPSTDPMISYFMNNGLLI